MGALIKGGNAFVPTVPLRMAVRGAVDVAALLLTERGRVRGDADIVFHGAPVHPSGAVRLVGGEEGAVWLETGLTAVEEDVSRVLVVVSTENGALRDVDGLSVEAFAPDGSSVARYDTTDAGGETAMVLAELYRRAGGWKFRAVGQGYLNGLEGLAVDHGVDVAEEPPAKPLPPEPQDPEPRTPEPRSPEVRAPEVRAPEVPFRLPTAPAPAPYSSPTPVPDWTFGGFFEPHTRSGPGNDVITVKDLPPGPVVVELAVDGDGYTGLWPLDRLNKQGSSLVNSTQENFRGRLLVSVPENGRLRLKLRADGPWEMRVLPLAAARRLTEDRLECEGPDVLLHTGGTADAVFRYKGDDNFIVYVYELAEHDDPTSLPSPGSSAVNEIGRRRETVPLPEGPVIVHLMRADGPWHARLKEVRPHSGVPGKAPEPRRAQGRLRWGRR
ncbi:TerD family protein [Streptomyces sp. TLI_105]|uniref:TerD family protein n=1 Tax=Streptomyces sp. TLI_105 TaxID=1881019 RepID=UPI00089A630F|nr:TerD family protein [Streptomyces sp. TLI_105]SEC64621.1 tellurite resistance protein TerA [Streptomyces sp. TLI_105]